jgi:hypothetical protein
MKIIALEKEQTGLPASAFQPYLKQEAEQVWQLYQAGFIREIYFRQDRNDAVLVIECDSTKTAQDQLKTLPLVQAGLIEFELIPLRPYSGFSRLFSIKN